MEKVNRWWCLWQVGVQQFYKRRPIATVHFHSPSSSTTTALPAADDDHDTHRYHGNMTPPSASESAHRLQPARHEYVCPSVRPSVCLSQLWRFGVEVTALDVSAELLYVEPG